MDNGDRRLGLGQNGVELRGQGAAAVVWVGMDVLLLFLSCSIFRDLLHHVNKPNTFRDFTRSKTGFFPTSCAEWVDHRTDCPELGELGEKHEPVGFEFLCDNAITLESVDYFEDLS
ncbi:hypothetical protein ACET3Z_018857 [Daucus carota]